MLYELVDLIVGGVGDIVGNFVEDLGLFVLELCPGEDIQTTLCIRINRNNCSFDHLGSYMQGNTPQHLQLRPLLLLIRNYNKLDQQFDRKFKCLQTEIECL